VTSLLQKHPPAFPTPTGAFYPFVPISMAGGTVSVPCAPSRTAYPRTAPRAAIQTAAHGGGKKPRHARGFFHLTPLQVPPHGRRADKGANRRSGQRPLAAE